ncbi:MAG: sugar nucleotide-binding protein, partial [Burkholderiales bacterium]|nr:sugar nucleotide-binding protein [Burkholderiales bacterium]
DDQVGSPSWARMLALSTAELLGKMKRRDEASGVYHLSAPDSVSRYDFAKKIIETAQRLSGGPSGWAGLRPVHSADYPRSAAVRPLNTVASKEKIRRTFGIEMPGWEAQLEAFFASLPNGMRL